MSDDKKTIDTDVSTESSVPVEKLLAVALLVPMGDPNDKYCPWGLNTFFHGPPGVGKSDRVMEASAIVGLPPRTVYAATTQPEDVSGAAFQNTSKFLAMFEGGLAALLEDIEPENFGEELGASGFFQGIIKKFIRPTGVKVLKRMLAVAQKYGSSTTVLEPLLPGISDLMIDQQGVLFLDELSCARPAVQGAYLGVALTRRVAGRQLPGGVRIIAAGNPPDTAAGGWELEPPMANRFCHFEVKAPSTEEWNTWLLNEGGSKLDPIEEGEARIRQRWSEEWAIVKGMMAGFMDTQDDKALFKIPPEGNPQRGRAWPSPRTWTFAARAIATCRCLGLDENVRDAFVEGCVGSGGATALAAWIAESNLPTPQHMLEHGFEPDKKRLDRNLAAYTTLISFVKSRKTQEQRIAIAPGAWRCIKQSADAGMLDITLPMAQQLVKNGLDSKASPEIAEVCKPVLSRLAKAGMANFLTDA